MVRKDFDTIVFKSSKPSVPFRNAARYRLSFVYRFNAKENQSVRQAKTGNRN